MYRQRSGEILKKIIQQKFVSVNFFSFDHSFETNFERQRLEVSLAGILV